jgi:hypothetical protein
MVEEWKERKVKRNEWQLTLFFNWLDYSLVDAFQISPHVGWFLSATADTMILNGP